MLLSIIIISYRSEGIIERCIRSISYDQPYEIIIVDNENNKGLIKKLSMIKNVKIIRYTKNLGFSKANNIAIRQAKGEYILTLNADVFLTEDYIRNCISFLDKNPEYGSIQGKLLMKNKKNTIDSTGNILSTSGFAYNENHKVKDHKTPSKEVFGVCAAAAIYRKKALEEIKLPRDEYFDSDFFAYLEDVDLDWRLRLKGHKTYFLNTAIAYHIRESTTNSSYRFRQALRNRLYLVLKNDTTLSMLLNLIFYTPVLFFLPNRIKNLLLIPKMLKKRKIIQNTKRISHNKIRPFIQKTPWKRWIRITKLIKLARG